MNHAFWCLHLCLLFVLALLVLTSHAAASTLSLSAPSDVNICGNGSYSLSYDCSNDVSNASASILVPIGFQYSEKAKLIFNGRESFREPSTIGQLLTWDLTTALRSCRYIVINEWEANPTGSDTNKEWVELFNPTPEAAGIGGWKLVDSYYGKIVSIPVGTTIAAGGYYVLIWTNGSLINSYPVKITLLNSAGQAVDSTAAKKDDKSDDRCWARCPNGKDLEDDLEWRFQDSTSGSSNGGGTNDIYAGESLALQFNLSAGCNAPEKASISADVATSGGKVTAESSVITIHRANLVLSITPDKYEAKEGEEIVWTIRVNNNGTGIATDVQVNAVLGNGLQLIGIDSPNKGPQWSYASAEPGSVNEVRLTAKVSSTYDYYSCLVNAEWGSGPCQEVSQCSHVSQWTSIHKSPDSSRNLAVGEIVGYEIRAELPRGAHDLWINDTVAKGLNYNPGSFSVQGIALQEETIVANSDGTTQVCWFFGDLGLARNIAISYNCTLANLPGNLDGVLLAGTKAYMGWRDESGVKSDVDEAGSVSVIEPDLVVEMGASSSVVGPGDKISYTLVVYHSSQSSSPAFDVNLHDILPDGLVYLPGTAVVLNGPTAAFDESDLMWHFDVVNLDWNADRKIMMMLNATSRARPGDAIVNNLCLTWTSLAGEHAEERTGSGGVNDYLRRTMSSANAMDLSIHKIADPDPVKVGEILSYTLVYENEGGGMANNVTLLMSSIPASPSFPPIQLLRMLKTTHG